MKITYLTFFVSLLCTCSIVAQNGLEQVIVEKYYISEENDTIVNEDGGRLPVGSVTYRVYVDLLPDYSLKSIYANEDHELRIGSTTRFFNNEDRGASVANDIGRNRLDDNTVMLDSWLTVGGSCGDCIGVQKHLDDGIDNIENGDDVLLNDDMELGIPLTEQDGHIEGSPRNVTLLNISNEIEIFDVSNDLEMPTIFTTNNGAWASLEGVIAPDSAENVILIGQFTTDGVFSFELNILIKNEILNEGEFYVARNPINDERTIPSLIYTSMPSSTNEEIKEVAKSHLSIYPNPASTTIQLLDRPFEGEVQYEIIKMNGQVVQKGETMMEAPIDVSNLAIGSYRLTVTDGKSREAGSFIKINY